MKRAYLLPEASATLTEVYRPAFLAETRERIATGGWIVNLMAFVLIPGSFFMDWLNYPQHFGTLLRARVWCVAGLLLCAAFYLWARRRGKAAAIARLYVWLLVADLSVFLSYIALVAGGPETPYYAGLTLLLTAVAVAIPWGLLEMSLIMGFMIVQFDLAMLLFDDTRDWVLFFDATYFYVATAFMAGLYAFSSQRLRLAEFSLRKEVEEQRLRSENLLLNILPADVAEELMAHGHVDAKHIDCSTILFTDFVGFTRMAGRVPPKELVRKLDEAFSLFDAIVKKWDVEKLKTIGDAYMCAGVDVPGRPHHQLRCILAGLEMLHVLESEDLRDADDSPWRMRIGIHTGPVVAGVIGRVKFAYDLWGDTVNTASRLESSGQPRSINVSTTMYKRVERFFVGVDRGFVPVRGKGPMAMTRITRLRPEYSSDAAGHTPNELLLASIDAFSEGVPAPDAPTGPKQGEKLGGIDLGAEGLEALRVLSELTPDDREVLLRVADPMTFEPDQVLIEQGQSLSALFLIIAGRVGVRVGREGVFIEVGMIGAGGVVGELSFVSYEPASATVLALEKVIAFRFDQDWVESLAEKHPDTGVRLFHSIALILAGRLRDSNARLFAWGAGPEAARHAGHGLRQLPSRTLTDDLAGAIRRFRGRMHALEDGDGGDPLQEVASACDDLVEAGTRAALQPGTAVPHFDGALTARVLRDTFSYFMRGPLLERLYIKPNGNALDFEAAERMYADVPRDGVTLAGAIDAWFLAQPPASAIRACMQAVRRLECEAYESFADRSAEFRLAVLSCGAAPQFLDTLRTLGHPPNLLVTCLDRSLGALSSLGRRAVEEGLVERFTFVCQQPAVGGGERPRIRVEPHHFASLSVLLDARDDHEVVHLLDEVYENLLPGGVFVMGVLDLPPKACFIAEGLLEWPIAQWREEQLRRVAVQSAFPDDGIHVTPTGDGASYVMTFRRSE